MHPTISRQFDSDQTAQAVLKEALMGSFLLRECKPDFFGDYYAELRNEGEPSGELMLIQLKGQQELKKSGELGKVQLEVKALRYYANNAEQPVFIILVDNKNRRGYYLFVQAWLDENPNVLDKVNSGRATVSVPLRNELSVVPKFISDFRAAARVMKEKRPSSPEAALDYLVAPLNKLDPRFCVKASIGPAGRAFSITAKEPTNILLTIKGPQASLDQFVEGMGYGKSVSVSDIKLAASGSALFEELVKSSASLSFTPAEKRECLVTISCDHHSARFSLTLPSLLSAGPRGICVISAAANCPLEFEQIFAHGDDSAGKSKITVTAKREVWEGRQILAAPWFDDVTNFTKAVVERKSMKIRLEIEGKIALNTGISFPSIKGTPTGIWRWFWLLRKAAEVSRQVGINPVIPSTEGLEMSVIERINMAYDMLTQPVIIRPFFGYSQQVPSEAWVAFVDAARKNNWEFRSFNQYHTFTASVFGETKEIGILQIEPRDVKIAPSQEVDLPITAKSLEGKRFEIRPLKGKFMKLKLLRNKKIEDVAPVHTSI